VNSGDRQSFRKNCWACTAGATSRPMRTSSDIAQSVGLPENRGLSTTQMVSVLNHLGLGNGRSALFTSWDAAHAFMNGRPDGAEFAVSYSWNDGAKGHVLVAQKDDRGVTYRDFQALGSEVPRPDKPASGIIVTPLTELNGLPNRGLFSKSAVLNERDVSRADRDLLTRNLLNARQRSGNIKRDWATLLHEMRPRPVPAARNGNAFLRFVRNPLAFIRGAGPTKVAGVAISASTDAGRPSRQGAERVIEQVSTSSSAATHNDAATTTEPVPSSSTTGDVRALTDFGRFVAGQATTAGGMALIDAEQVAFGSNWFRRARENTRGIGARWLRRRPGVQPLQVNGGETTSWDNTGDNNCVLCTAGGSSRPRISSGDAARQAKVLQGPLTLHDAARVLTANGLGDGRAAAFTNWDDAGRFMRGRSRGSRFALAYFDGSGHGHAIAAQRGRLFGAFRYRDYQRRNIQDAQRPTEHMQAARAIFVFPLNHRAAPTPGQMILNMSDMDAATQRQVADAYGVGSTLQELDEQLQAGAEHGATLHQGGDIESLRGARRGSSYDGRSNSHDSDSFLNRPRTHDRASDTSSLVVEHHGADDASSLRQPASEERRGVTPPSSPTPPVAAGPWARREAEFRQYRDERMASLVRPPRMMQQPVKSSPSEVCR
jgi:hypothetical protein